MKKLLYTLLLLASFSHVVDGQIIATNDQNLDHFLDQIGNAKDVNFLYEAKLTKDRQVNTNVDLEKNVNQILEKVLNPIGLAYKQLDDYNYIITSRETQVPKLTINKPHEIPIQKTISYSGVVKDQLSLEPLIGASIVVVGLESSGTITDYDGNFSLDIPEEYKNVLVTYIGYKAQEITLTDNRQLEIFMQENINDLDEVVITAVGIQANKRLLGYSVNEVKAADIENSGEANILNALSGKTAGVQITSSSGSPGASANIRIRGNKSLNGNNKPLIIVDGIPIDNSSAGNSNAGVDVSNRAIDINPNDIQSVSVLKGPAATALYGIRAANGALIITTKTGKKGKPTVNIRSSYGISKVNKYPARQYTYAQGNYLGGVATYLGPELGEANSYGPRISDLEYDGDASYIFDQQGRLVAKGAGNGIAAMIHRPEEDFFTTGTSFDQNVSVSGGSDVLKYYISGGALNQTGVVPLSTWSRYSFKANFDVNLNDRLSLTTNTSVIRSGGDRKNKGNALSGVSIGLYRTPISFDNGAGLQGINAAETEASYIFPNGEQRAYRGSNSYDNPYWSVNRVPFTDNVNRIIQGIGLSYKLIEGVQLTYKVGLDNYSDKRNAAWDIKSGSEITGRVDERTIISTDVNSDLILTASKRFRNKLRFESTIGHNFFSSNYESRTTRGLDLTKQGFFSLTNATNIETDQFLSRRQLFGAYADFKFGWNDIAYINLTGRNDWSSTLPTENNSFFYSTVSAGLEFSELLGLTDSRFLSYGKLRASFGEVGNDPGIYQTVNYFQQATVGGDGLLPSYSFPAFGINSFERSVTLGNANLKAEKTTTFEIGTDLKLFRGKANIDFTYYKAETTDLIVQSQISAASGFTVAPVNAGEILNEGIEVLLNLRLIDTRDFSWDMDFNFTKSKNIVVDLPEGIDQIELASFTALSSLAVEGEPYGIFVGTAYSRNEEGQLIIGADGWPLTAPEQIKVGDPNPDWIGGVRNTFSYKGLTLSGLIDVRQGGDIYNGTKGVLNNLGIGEESGADREVTGYVYDGVTESGEANTTPVDFANPANGSSGIKWRRNSFLGLAEENIEDGSWVRLRELTLGYVLPSSWFTKLDLSGASASFSGRNLWLNTKYTGVDPETNLRGDTNDTGWDYFNLPNTKSFTLSLNLKF